MDGVAGSAAVSTSDPTLVERILQYEICGRISSYRCDILICHAQCITGNYRDAAACYERAIQVNPSELTYHEVQEYDVFLVVQLTFLLGV